MEQLKFAEVTPPPKPAFQIRDADIPERYREIVTAVGGPQAFIDLCHALGGRVLYLPRPEYLFRRARDRAIRADHNAGMGVAALATHYHLTLTRIRQILDEPDQDSPEK